MNRFRHAALLLVAMSALVRADTALLTLVSPDAKAIGGINVMQTRNSPFGQFLLGQMKEDDAGFREFVNATGFDPRNDLSYVVFASPAEGTKRGVVIARGRFNGPQIFAAAKAKGSATTQNYRGVDLLLHDNSALAIIDGQLAIAGDEAMVKAAIDRRAMSGPAAAPLLQKASAFSARYHSWMVTSGMNTRLPQMGGRPGAPNPAFESILETGGGVNFGTVIEIEGEALTKTDADAKALVQIAQFLTGMMALNNKTPQGQQIQNILQTLDVKAQGTTVKMSLRVSESDLEEIIKTPKRARRSASL